jgi:hypothetical protein
MTKQMLKPNEVTSIRAEYLDCCLPDYFPGSNADEVLAVPVWHGITYREAYNAAKSEFHASSGYFDDVPGSGSMAEDALHAMFASMLAEDTDRPADFARYIEPDEEGERELVFLYIGLYAED